MSALFKVLFLVAVVCTSLVSGQKLLSATLEQKLNDQINLEYEALYLYDQLAAYFSRSNKALFGFAAYFKKAASEERDHAHELTDLVTKRLGTVIYKEIPITTSKLNSESSVVALKTALQKEIDVSTSFQELYEQAQSDKDVHIQDQLDHFVNEQVDAIYHLKSLITRLEGKGDTVEFLLDQELKSPPSMH
ncbi:hypothetical protein ACTXT7_015403 [Hymenolepis weldensis]